MPSFLSELCELKKMASRSHNKPSRKALSVNSETWAPPVLCAKNGWNKKHKSYFAAVSFFICLRRVLPGRGQLWRQSCTNRSPERHSLINCRVQPERANSSLRSSDSARFVAASLTLIIRVVMVRFGLDAVITVGLVFYIFT